MDRRVSGLCLCPRPGPFCGPWLRRRQKGPEGRPGPHRLLPPLSGAPSRCPRLVCRPGPAGRRATLRAVARLRRVQLRLLRVRRAALRAARGGPARLQRLPRPDGGPRPDGDPRQRPRAGYVGVRGHAGPREHPRLCCAVGLAHVPPLVHGPVGQRHCPRGRGPIQRRMAGLRVCHVRGAERRPAGGYVPRGPARREARV